MCEQSPSSTLRYLLLSDIVPDRKDHYQCSCSIGSHLSVYACSTSHYTQTKFALVAWSDSIHFSSTAVAQLNVWWLCYCTHQWFVPLISSHTPEDLTALRLLEQTHKSVYEKIYYCQHTTINKDSYSHLWPSLFHGSLWRCTAAAAPWSPAPADWLGAGEAARLTGRTAWSAWTTPPPWAIRGTWAVALAYAS